MGDEADCPGGVAVMRSSDRDWTVGGIITGQALRGSIVGPPRKRFGGAYADFLPPRATADL